MKWKKVYYETTYLDPNTNQYKTRQIYTGMEEPDYSDIKNALTAGCAIIALCLIAFGRIGGMI